MSDDAGGEPPRRAARLAAAARRAAAAALRSVARRIEGTQASEPGAPALVEAQRSIGREPIWATEQQIAQLLGIDGSQTARLIRDALAELEMFHEVGGLARRMPTPAQHTHPESRGVSQYSLAMIIAVGQRATGPKGVDFRRWVRQKMSAYLRHGYLLDAVRLNEDPEACQPILDEIRALHAGYKDGRSCEKA
jgi:hypothetical protein